MLRTSGTEWSGEATRGLGFAAEDTRVDVTIGEDNEDANAANHRKERPIWMTESTVLNADSQVCFAVLSKTKIVRHVPKVHDVLFYESFLECCKKF